jgi:hypothetical protein
MRKWVIGATLTIVVVLALVPVVALYILRPKIHAILRSRVENVLKIHFESAVEISDFSASIFPRVHVTITGLVLRHKSRTDIAPFIEVRKVSMDADLASLLQARPHIAFVQLEGLQIHTPPREQGADPLIQSTDQDLAKKYPVLIDQLVADDATIVVLRAQPGKIPREFPIHHLHLRGLSFDRPAEFQATLTNSVPKGEINTTGQFGPWLAEEPSETRAVGTYTFYHADLGTLKGLRGILSSNGKFSGPLDYLSVDGETDTPDFALRTADHPMALHTDFSAIVDGTNGDTYLNSVTARFLHSTLLVRGKVVDENKEIKGRTIVLDAFSRGAHVEDLIRLVAKGDHPVMTGSVDLQTKITIPQGTPDLIERLQLQGRFGIGRIQFTNASTQGKIDTLSRKGQGEPKDFDITNVVSEMKADFGLRDAVVDFSDLQFGVAGAAINLNGTYNLDTEAMDFHGKLKLKAKPSQTTTGMKSFFMKALDPFFKGKDAGTVLAIKITGTKDHPSFGLDHGGRSIPAESSPPKGQ